MHSQPTSFSSFGTPQVNPSATPNTQYIVPAPSRSPAFAGTCRDCASYTAKHAEFFLNNKRYGIFRAGKEMLKKSDEPGPMPLQLLAAGAGCVLMMAAPVWWLIRVGYSLPRALFGALGTAVSGLFTAAEWVGLKAASQASQIATPTRAEQQREHLTQQFVNRMINTLAALPYNRKVYFKTHPEDLICICSIAVAFLSRSFQGQALKVGNQELGAEDIKGLDPQRQGYFFNLCEMKEAVQSLIHLVPNDDEAWAYLMNVIDTLDAPLSQNRALTDDEVNEKETAILLMQRAFALSQNVADDAVFKKLWTQSFPAQ